MAEGTGEELDDRFKIPDTREETKDLRKDSSLFIIHNSSFITHHLLWPPLKVMLTHS